MRVFVYGTLKRYQCNHYYLMNAELLGEFITPPEYTMYDLGAFPGVSLNGTDRIMGEVYEVEDLKPIDRLEGYPTLYNRTEIYTPFGKAWMYYLSPQNFNLNDSRLERIEGKFNDEESICTWR